MFDGGVPEQFHQFIASTSSHVPPLPLSFASFEPFPSHQSLQLQPHLLLHHKQQEKESNTLLPTSCSLQLVESERSIPIRIDPWSNDEVLSLLRIRSSMENWLPDFTWEHVSRKLGELGYRRSSEMCKEKFEEESRHLESITSTYTKNYRFFSELEEVCHGENSQVLAEKTHSVDVEEKNLAIDNEAETVQRGQSNNSSQGINETTKERTKAKAKAKKRKRQLKRFEMLKGFCEEVVNKMMAQQEEMHNKIIQDMARRDEEKLKREEAWKKQEMERINKEIEVKAREQAIAGDRQTKLIEFLKHFTASNPNSETSHEVSKGSVSSPSPSFVPLPQSPNPTSKTTPKNPSFLTTENNPTSPNQGIALENPSSSIAQNPSNKTTQNPSLGQNEREDIGKRWPRDEVLALINLRCSLNNNNNNNNNSRGPNEEKELGAKGPLWERISQGMLELGYKRSAKRCKEKWENINKYFRKTKDTNKKRSLDSRTCPYFHQLSSLYGGQGTLPVGPLDGPDNRSPEDCSDTPVNRLKTPHGDANAEGGEGGGGRGLDPVPGLEFEF